VYFVTIEIKFEYGHRLTKHQGKCCHIHGHNGVAIVEIESNSLNENDVVIDFGDVKKFFQEWIDVHWDHAFLMNTDDPLREILHRFDPKLRIFLFQQADPTAEKMAEQLYHVLKHRMPDNLRIRAVTIHETERNSATYIPSQP
jgi:6-pyruvoyltetrahydropterin/6-carboxytetrahydropterin synthase